MAYNFPDAPTPGQAYAGWVWDGEKWQAQSSTLQGAVRYDLAQGLTSPQQLQGRTNIGAVASGATTADGIQINGGMTVSQAYSQNQVVALSSGSSAYLADNWIPFFSGTSTISGYTALATGSPGITPPAGFAACLAMYTGTAAALSNGNGQNFWHKVEGYRMAKLGWGTAAAQPLSYAFMFYANVSGTTFVKVNNAAGNRIFYQEFTVTAPAWNFVKGTIPGCTDGVWENTNGTGMSFLIYVTGKDATPQVAGSWGTANANQTTNSQNLVVNTATTGITGVVLLPGSQPPASAVTVRQTMSAT